MSSFLRDSLIVTDGKEKVDFPEKVDTIKKEITKLKSVISELTKDKYIQFELNTKPDQTLVNKSEKLINDMKILQNRIDDQVKRKLLSSSKELQSLSSELKEYNYSLQLSKQLLEIHKNFESIRNLKSDYRFKTTAITLINLHCLVIEKSNDIQQLNIYQSIKEEYHKLYDDFIEEITTLWQDKISWNDGIESSDQKSACLCIKCGTDELEDIIQGLYWINRLNRCTDSLSKNVLKSFINPIINCQCTVRKSDRIFSVEILKRKQLPTYKSVLNNLQLLFQFLHQHFDILIEDNEYLIHRLSNSFLQDFSHILTNNCISKIIPSSSSELESFQSIIVEIEEFQNFLVEIKFITNEQKFLSKYTSNIDKLYIDKKCERFLEIARNIMKKDLHDSFKYTPDVIEKVPDNQGPIEDCMFETDRKLNKFIFQLPESQISKSALEVLNLNQEILEEACQSSETYALRLFYTSRNIFEMYASLVPEVHRSFLKTIPQQVALFHNNCFFLAHHLLTLGNKYKQKMPIPPQHFSMIYTDQVLLLRQVGSEYFLNHMKYQRDIIFDILRESGLSSIGQMPELPATTERALRQCIRQLELLRTVWIEILPMKMYCRVLGCILNDMADDLCSKVISVEDIPADVASELVTLFNMVVKRVPQIFPIPALIEHHVHKWRKLKELIIILGASLREIEDRWADGKGPLAIEFPAKHVKQLIRALFQNTERRSNLLSKIKEK